MKNFIVEVMDERDKDTPEPWSFFGAYQSLEDLSNEWDTLVEYLQNYPIVEIRIKQL